MTIYLDRSSIMDDVTNMDSCQAICHTMVMPRRSSKTTKEHDFMTVARRVVEEAIGEKLDGSPLEDPNAGKNPHAVALGRMGGKKGGKARAEKLSPRRRKQIAKKAAAVRWSKS